MSVVCVLYACDTDDVLIVNESDTFNFLPVATVWRHARARIACPVFSVPVTDLTDAMFAAGLDAIRRSDMSYTIGRRMVCIVHHVMDKCHVTIKRNVQSHNATVQSCEETLDI